MEKESSGCVLCDAGHEPKETVIKHVENHQYRLFYGVADGGEDEKHLKERFGDDLGNYIGACDAFIFASILYLEDGSYSLQYFSQDGRNNGKELNSNEIFKAWILLASNLMEKKDLPEWKRMLAEMTLDGFKKFSGIKK